MDATPLPAGSDSGIGGARAGGLRRGLLNLHLYGGLAAFWYFLIYGITSLNFNHPGLIPKLEGPKRVWTTPLVVPAESDNLKLAEAVRDRLGLAGWPLPWDMGRDADGELHFAMSRPGKDYRIHVDASEGLARVEEHRTGWPSILGFLHGSTEGVPNAPWTRAWAIYTEFTTAFLFFAVGSGIYLWARRATRRRAALLLLGGCAAASLGLMAWVYWIG
ncbi:MAG: PepSY-associated TM helix domain-containing protein [Verrucomicrobia bacterium]|nr:PepSY-associated TM helix domain-containing protein [Verrucomicrobiota bacterium]